MNNHNRKSLSSVAPLTARAIARRRSGPLATALAFAVAGLMAAALTGTSQAGIIFSGTANSTGFTVDSTTPLSIVNADISYNDGENNFVPGGPSYWNVLDNGSFGGTGKTGSTVISGDTSGNGLLWKLTSGAADIGSISVYSGWTDNGRMEQHYSIYTTTDATVNGASTWTLLAAVGGTGSNGSTTFGDATNNQLKVTIYNDTNSILAAGVTGLRFNFAGGQQNGGVGYKEIDVLTVVPEPGTLGLLAFGALALLGRRRGRNR